MEKLTENRRSFLKKLGLAGALGFFLPRAVAAVPYTNKAQSGTRLPVVAKTEPRAVIRSYPA